MNKPLLSDPARTATRTGLIYLKVTFSIVVPLAMVLMDAFLHFHINGVSHGQWLIELLLVITGFIAGITILAKGRRHSTFGVFVTAIIGTVANGLLMLFIFATLCFVSYVGRYHSQNPNERLDSAMTKLAMASSEEKRFYALDDAAKRSFAVGHVNDARRYANELLTLAPNYRGNWNYGNAIQDGNLVLGRIAVRENNIQEAKYYLLEAGQTPGSPTLDNFGPNMSLANDLLKKGERETVLQYFQLCSNFWKMDYGALEKWRRAVEAGKVPNFGPNLAY